MAAKQIDVTCPCCATRITVDVLTGQVLRHARADDAASPERWDSAHERVRDRTERTDETLDDALSHERRRRSSFDDLFRAASDKVRDRAPEDEGPKRPSDSEETDGEREA